MPELLTMNELPNLRDGAFGLQVDQYIRMLMRDCDDRPSLQKARKLEITLEFMPEPDDGSRTMGAVQVKYYAKPSMPGMSKLSQRLEVVRGENEAGQLEVAAIMPHPVQDQPGQGNLFKKDRSES